MEAAHLYAFAAVGEHHEHGDLLMRRDLHRLFDLGLITVDPATQTIDIACSFASYPIYADMDAKPLHVDLKGRQLAWLQEHWREHRPHTN